MRSLGVEGGHQRLGVKGGWQRTGMDDCEGAKNERGKIVFCATLNSTINYRATVVRGEDW
jgi:hypothetical protein